MGKKKEKQTKTDEGQEKVKKVAKQDETEKKEKGVDKVSSFFTTVWGKVVLVVSALIFILLTIWLGYSFYSLTRDDPKLEVKIDLSDNPMLEKTGIEATRIQGSNYEFDSLFILEEISETEDQYILKGTPFVYQLYFDSKEDAKFTYYLDKEKGLFEFSELEWEPLLLLTLRYKVNKDMKYFLEYSMCTLDEFLGNGDGTCVLDRDIYEWELTLEDKGKERPMAL